MNWNKIDWLLSVITKIAVAIFFLDEVISWDKRWCEPSSLLFYYTGMLLAIGMVFLQFWILMLKDKFQ